MPRTAYIELWLSSNGRWYFHKKSRNNQIVTTPGQGYKEKRYAKVAIRREHPGLPIYELTGEVV